MKRGLILKLWPPSSSRPDAWGYLGQTEYLVSKSQSVKSFNQNKDNPLFTKIVFPVHFSKQDFGEQRSFGRAPDAARMWHDQGAELGLISTRSACRLNDRSCKFQNSN